ncbi:hypothetical protein DHEL01_v210911 [Diaporthe helianthi]|uniref:Sodium/calcium exchanger membrane region domain-containing protein n=1 Tax=Diaporthe helianthi TaxID=158607 RepID=A0A2P5HKA8_DIAHE|nr:hypothetical protein DHEL01_v210911 [Diaporthe helianthi]
MADGNVIAYNIAVFTSALFLLEFGADKFVDHTAIVARRTGIPDTIIALLTAGAEWEELVVVVSSLAQGRSSLAVGNIVGSAISNILGAFSLGLLFRGGEGPAQFDRSSRIYSVLLLIVTTFVIPITYFSRGTIWTACGAVLILVFAVYLVSVGLAISKGHLTAPEDSDDSSGEDSDTESTRTSVNEERSEDLPGVSTPLLQAQRVSRERRSLRYHIFYLTFGFLAICLAGYVISHAAMNITDAVGLSDVLFGVIVLAVATTLPEKFVAVMSGRRGHIGILVANTAGSNIFLLSLCMGIIMVDTSGEFNGGNVNIYELAVLWGLTLAFALTVYVGGRFDRWIGGAMLICYVVFIVLEFTVIHNRADKVSYSSVSIQLTLSETLLKPHP